MIRESMRHAPQDRMIELEQVVRNYTENVLLGRPVGALHRPLSAATEAVQTSWTDLVQC